MSGKTIVAAFALFTGLLLFAAQDLEAAGKRQINTQTASGIDIWQQEFDASELKPGKYNVIIRAKDAAGNVGTSGPFNVRVDPNTGLPVARIVYPEEGACLRGELQLIGVASGRYGIKQVMLKLDDDEYSPVEGIEYWSRHFSDEMLSEGRHTVYAKAIDDEGLEGPEFAVAFVVDRAPPSIEITNYKTGDLISGNKTLAGIADDPNGIRSMSWSTDGAQWRQLSLKQRKGQTQIDFSIPLRTKNLDDGPQVYYVRAVDSTGFVSIRPYLFFIDNEAPLLEIITPEKNESVYGTVQVSGRVIDTVGLEKFYYTWAEETVDIPLRPGDPFWTVTVPVSLANNRSTSFKITAVDKSGNETSVTQRLQDNRKQKTPTITIDYPSTQGLNALPQNGTIYGRIDPGFFPSSIIVEGIPEEIPAGPGFRIPPELISDGRSTLRLWAKAGDDTLGNAFVVRVNKPAPQNKGEEIVVPPPIVPSPIEITSPEPYAYCGNSFRIAGTVPASARLEYRLNPAAEWMPLAVSQGGAFASDINLAEIAEGPVHLELRTIQRGTEDYPVYHPINKYSTRPEIAFFSPTATHGAIQGNVTVSGAVNYFVPLKELSYSLDGNEFVPLDHIAKYGKAWFSYFCDFSALEAAGRKLVIRAVDMAGTVVEHSPSFVFDDSTDKPVTIVNSPLDREVITESFEISGLAFDDDKVREVRWRVLSPETPFSPVEETAARGAGAEYKIISTSQSFQIDIPFSMVKDGENIIEVYAEDIYGVPGDVIRRTVLVSTAPPETVVSAPAIDIYNRRNIEISGNSFDLNGVKDILVSMDNGNSYQKADVSYLGDGNCAWNLSLNTQAYQDGVYSLLIRSLDRYDLAAFSNALVNIDNTPPEISLGTPYNGESLGTSLSVTGQAIDRISLKSISLQLVNINDSSQQLSYEIRPDFVIMEQVDIASLSNGDYNLKLNAVDLAGNETAVTRDIKISRETSASEVALINPLPGIDHSGALHISGRVTGAHIPRSVNIMANGEYLSAAGVDRYGVFSYELSEENLKNETVILSASFDSPNGEKISSYENEVALRKYGPEIVVDSHRDGDVVTHRPWISGRAFVSLDPAVQETLTRKQRAEFAVKAVSISLDNGRSFQDLTGKANWKYRLETGDLEAGPLPLIFKAEFADGTFAIRRIILTVDTGAPLVAAMGPAENSTHRNSVLVYGSASDEFDMDSVEVSFRPGDKAGYSVPQFIQGLYLDANFLGATTYSLGLGLSFFDNNVKLQMQAGQAPPGRYTGTVVGAKLIANILYLPFTYFFGPDWECFSMSLAMGANFSWFSMETGKPDLMMGALLAQWEFARLDMSYFFPKWQYFKSLSLYVEPIFWFASSDVAAGAIFRVAIGTRISLF